MKAHITRTIEGLSEACDALSVCARYVFRIQVHCNFGIRNERIIAKRLQIDYLLFSSIIHKHLTTHLHSYSIRYDPSTGYSWKFEPSLEDGEDDDVTVHYGRERKKRRKRRVLDNRRPGER